MSDPKAQEVIQKVINKMVRITISDGREYLGKFVVLTSNREINEC